MKYFEGIFFFEIARIRDGFSRIETRNPILRQMDLLHVPFGELMQER